MAPRSTTMLRLGLVLLLGMARPPSAVANPLEQRAWAALTAGGVVALMRHATAPGTGDPPEFRLDDCATQRNLSPAGRQEAAAIGTRLKAQGVKVGRVLSSEWCRCLDTARLMDVGSVERFSPINSFFRGGAGQAEAQTAAVIDWLAATDPEGVVVMVTHQVNITALTGHVPSPGEIVVVRPKGDGGRLPIVGTIPPP